MGECCQHGLVPVAVLFSSSHGLQSFRGFPDGNLVPKHNAFQMTKPERPKHGSPVGCEPLHPPLKGAGQRGLLSGAPPPACPKPASDFAATTETDKPTPRYADETLPRQYPPSSKALFSRTRRCGVITRVSGSHGALGDTYRLCRTAGAHLPRTGGTGTEETVERCTRTWGSRSCEARSRELPSLGSGTRAPLPLPLAASDAPTSWPTAP